MNILCLLMAAGASRRFDGIKQLANLSKTRLPMTDKERIENNDSLLHRAYLTHSSAKFDQIQVVLGANAQAVKCCLPRQASCIYAEHWELGLGHSISDAVKTVSPDVSHVYISLADQVALKDCHINQMLNECKQYPEKVIAARYQNKVGAPAIFPRSYFEQLENLKGDKGAKDLLIALQQNGGDQLHRIDIVEAAVDIDTQDQLAAFITQNNSMSIRQQNKPELAANDKAKRTLA